MIEGILKKVRTGRSEILLEGDRRGKKNRTGGDQLREYWLPGKWGEAEHLPPSALLTKLVTTDLLDLFFDLLHLLLKVLQLLEIFLL